MKALTSPAGSSVQLVDTVQVASSVRASVARHSQFGAVEHSGGRSTQRAEGSLSSVKTVRQYCCATSHFDDDNPQRNVPPVAPAAPPAPAFAAPPAPAPAVPSPAPPPEPPSPPAAPCAPADAAAPAAPAPRGPSSSSPQPKPINIDAVGAASSTRRPTPARRRAGMRGGYHGGGSRAPRARGTKQRRRPFTTIFEAQTKRAEPPLHRLGSRCGGRP